jgi:FxsC-like protein
LDPYFFLSYARRRGPQVLVKRFYDDLCAELRRLRERITEPIGPPFLDVLSIQVGQDWNAALGDAVGRCRTMVALYSPDYFRSDFCGREWKAFEDRQRGHREVARVDAKALIPVLWEPVHSVPSGAAHIQYENIEFGENYARVGLRRILAADPGGEYRRIVELLARQIVVAAEHFRIPAVDGVDLMARDAAGPFPSAGDRAEPGSRALLLLAARTADIAHALPSDPGCHGNSPADWNPFHEECPDPLLTRAGLLLEERGFTVRTEMISDALCDSLEAARLQGQVAILLVEAGAAVEEPFAAALRAYDRGNHPGSAAVVPCGADEADLGPQGKSYWETVRGAFPLNWAKGAGDPLPLLQLGVGHERFDGTLHAVVAKAQNHLLTYLEIPPADPVSRPSLPVLNVVANSVENAVANPPAHISPLIPHISPPPSRPSRPHSSENRSRTDDL